VDGPSPFHGDRTPTALRRAVRKRATVDGDIKLAKITVYGEDATRNSRTEVGKLQVCAEEPYHRENATRGSRSVQTSKVQNEPIE